jgi:hypothetical protein
LKVRLWVKSVDLSEVDQCPSLQPHSMVNQFLLEQQSAGTSCARIELRWKKACCLVVYAQPPAVAHVSLHVRGDGLWPAMC